MDIKRKWSVEEIELLKKEYSTKTIKQLIEIFPDRLENAIIKKAKRLGLKKLKIDNVWEKWSDDENEILKKYYPITKNSEMCKYLPNRSCESIISRANNMNITKEYKYSWSDDEIIFLKQNYKKYKIKELSYFLKKSSNAIKPMLKKLGLSKQKERIDLSYENCISTAKLFKSKTLLRKKHPHMYAIASKNGWIEDMTSHMISSQFSTPQLYCQFNKKIKIENII